MYFWFVASRKITIYDGFCSELIKLLADDEIREFKIMFEKYDEDGSGTIDKNELKKICETLGEHVSRERLRDIVGKIDVDHNGSISFQEFVGMILMFRMGNPKLTLSSMTKAAAMMVSKLVANPKNIIKSVLDETKDGSKLMVEKTQIYKVTTRLEGPRFSNVVECIDMQHSFVIYIIDNMNIVAFYSRL